MNRIVPYGYISEQEKEELRRYYTCECKDAKYRCDECLQKMGPNLPWDSALQELLEEWLKDPYLSSHAKKRLKDELWDVKYRIYRGITPIYMDSF